MSQFLHRRATGFGLVAAIVGLALATAYIHLTLGGLLFTLNGLGYLGLAILYIIVAVAPFQIVRRFAWFPRVAIVGYAAVTVVAYLVMGPYFSLGWIAKAIELALIALVIADVVRVYGSPVGLVHAAFASIAPFIPSRSRPASA